MTWLVALMLTLALSGPAHAQAAFYGDGVVPLAPEFRSVRVLRRDEPIFSEPSSASVKRGAAARGAPLPVFGAQRGPGCGGRWFSVGPHAFICEDGAAPALELPLGFDVPEAPTALGLPYQYYFVSPDGSFGYRGLESAEEGVPEAQFQPGFGIAVERTAPKPGSGDPFGLTSRGFWIPLRDLAPVTPVSFEGNAFTDDLAWVIHEAAPVFSAPNGRRLRTLDRLTAVRVLETRAHGGQRYARVDEGAWVRERDLRSPQRASPPPDVRANERWIDIDLERQIVVAYVGATPWFATLISSGRGPLRSESATPEGAFRIWVKLRTSDMDNLENLSVRENYAIEAVPWVMFFERGYGLHGTFWHRRFGEVRSHGCVNLAPRDAERLFAWTSPRLLPGWTAVFPNAHEAGTVVRVRRAERPQTLP
jgi:lipoprotein-anchoring transpeptidase ErfK/SrfK